MGDTATSLLCDTMQVHKRCTGAHQFFLWPPDLPKPVQIKGIGTICQITDNGCFSAPLVPAKNGEQSYPNYLLRRTEQGVRKAQCWEQQHSNTFVSHRAPSPHWRPTAVSALPRTQSFLIHLSGTQIYLLSDQRMFLSKPTKPGRKGPEWRGYFFHNNFQRLSSHPCLPAHGGSFVAEDGGSWEVWPYSGSHAGALQRGCLHAAVPARHLPSQEGKAAWKPSFLILLPICLGSWLTAEGWRAGGRANCLRPLLKHGWRKRGSPWAKEEWEPL